jgi:hypothetical protein
VLTVECRMNCGSPAESAMPKRLIKLNAHNESKLSLVATQGRQMQYATLSYYWGTMQMAMTTRDNIANM